VLILAGGRSERLGREKPWTVVGDRTVFARQVQAAREIGDLIVSVRDPGPFVDALLEEGWGRRGEHDFELGPRRVRLVADPVPDLGPVAGLAAGLAAAEGDGVAVFSGDLPFVTAGLIDALFAELRAALEADPDLDAVIPVVAGREQPLCAAYRSEVATSAQAWLDHAPPPRGASVLGLLARLNARRVTDLGAFGPAALAEATRGIDTPEDLQWAQSRAATVSARAATAASNCRSER